MAQVAVTIVTYNSGASIAACLSALFAQTFTDYSVHVVDNASTDSTLVSLERWRDRDIRVTVNANNEYFARAQNAAIRRSDSRYVLTLNPDVVLRPPFLQAVVGAMEAFPSIGSVNGKLLLPPAGIPLDSLADQAPAAETLIDGAGIMMLRSRRPYLRGNREPHGVACLEGAPIFGVDAAAGLYRRTMLEDLAIDGEYFDEDFVIYREDVDLAWRAQIQGWDSRYEPSALAFHQRGFHLGRGRRAMDPRLKRLSVRNGWLLLIKNDDLSSLVRSAPFLLPYQAKIAAGLLFAEHSSLSALPMAAALLPRMMRKRAAIAARRRRSPEEMRRWFE